MRAARIAQETASRGFNPATYTRNPSYLSRTTHVDSCEAYVYTKYYDYERFLDSSYACGTNDQCVFDVAFKDYAIPGSGAPRVAKRPLLDREKAPLVSRSWAEVAGASLELNTSDLLPKNIQTIAIRPGFSNHVKELFGREKGCTHITELIANIATGAIQTMAGQNPHLRHPDKKPFQLDGCHALVSTGPAVATFYPRWYRATSDTEKI